MACCMHKNSWNRVQQLPETELSDRYLLNANDSNNMNIINRSEVNLDIWLTKSRYKTDLKDRNLLLIRDFESGI